MRKSKMTFEHRMCLLLPLQVTRPLSYTKRQFDVEEEDVDKLTLRWAACLQIRCSGFFHDSTWFGPTLFSQGGPVERQQLEVWRRVPGRGACPSPGLGSGWGSRRLVRAAWLSYHTCGSWTIIIWVLNHQCFALFWESQYQISILSLVAKQLNGSAHH